MNNLQNTVIIGGGLVGGLTALLLARSGIQATVLDAGKLLKKDAVLSEMDFRVLALNPATIHLLKLVNVWPLIERYAPYTGMHVWNKNGVGDIKFGGPSQYEPYEKEWLGAMVEPAILNFAIQQKMKEVLNCYRTEISIQNIRQVGAQWDIELTTGETISTRLLIGADGSRSYVREQANIQLDVLDYHQSAIGCAIYTEQPNQYVARQIFLPTGPLVYLPIASDTQGHWQSIVWTLPTETCQQYMQYSDEKFAQQLTQSSLYMLGNVKKIQRRASFPLKASKAKSYVKQGLALIGDAAHVIHPLAGQGVNIGCLDAAILCDTLIKNQNPSIEWGNLDTLKVYAHRRKIHNEMMMHGMTAMEWLQSSQWSPMIWARSFGLKRVDQSNLLKNFFIHQASGLPMLQETIYNK